MSLDESTPRFQRQQLTLAAHIRDPDNTAPPDIPTRRLAIYTEIFFNNINDQLSTNFPVLREITGDDQWHAIVRDFMIQHRCRTPLFTQIGQEFLAYLQQERAMTPDDWPFMLELAHYEYVELAVAISTEEGYPAAIDPNGDLLTEPPVIAPTAWNLTYEWPVHQIGPDFLPSEPPTEATHLVVYRDRDDDVHFLQINAVTQRLIQLLKDDEKLPGLDALKTIAAELGHQDFEQLLGFGTELLNELRHRHVILGTRA